MHLRQKIVLCIAMIAFGAPAGAQSFVPLEIGNTWSYYHWDQTFNDSREMSMTVVSSVVEPDGKEYFVLDSPWVSWIIGYPIRSDSIGLYQWNGHCDTLCRYDAGAGESWGGGRGGMLARWRGPTQLSTDSVRHLQINTSNCGCKVWLVEGMGITDMVAIGPEISQNLLGGIFGGKAWGSLAAHETPLVPTSLALSQNYPNPFSTSTHISFAAPTHEGQHAMATLILYDMYGREIRTLYRGTPDAEWHSVELATGELQSGCYAYVLTCGAVLERRTCIVVK